MSVLIVYEQLVECWVAFFIERCLEMLGTNIVNVFNACIYIFYIDIDLYLIHIFIVQILTFI